MKLKLLEKRKIGILAWFKNNFIIILILCAILAMIISMAIGLSQSVWFDEAYSIMLAKQPVAQLIHLTSVDTHPPFYYLLLSGWGNLFGWGEFALRSLSVLAMGGAVIIAGLLIKKLFGIRATLITLPFIIFAPFLLRYGFEIRMYSLASLIGIAATYLLVSALQTSGRKQILLFCVYAILVALGMLTLYYMALLWIAHFIWLLWRSYSNKESFFKSMWLKSYVLSVILFLPWLPTFISQISNGALAPIAQSMTLENLLGIISFSFVYRPIWQLGPLLSLVILFVIIMLAYLSIQAFRLIDKKRKQYLVLLAMYIIVPVAILTIIGLVRPMYVERYLAHVLIGGSLFVGVAISLIINKVSRVTKFLIIILAPVLLIGLVQLVQVGNFNFQRLQKPDIGSASLLISDCGTDRVVLAADPYVAIELSYYLSSCKINFYSDTLSLGGGYAPLSNSDLRIADPEAQLKSANVIYYAYYSEAKLKMPTNFSLMNKQTFDSLTIEQYKSGNY